VKNWFQAFAFKCNLYRYTAEFGIGPTHLATLDIPTEGVLSLDFVSFSTPEARGCTAGESSAPAARESAWFGDSTLET
jgi:hypothetical protein